MLLACIGGYKWDGNPREKRPETGLLKVRPCAAGGGLMLWMYGCMNVLRRAVLCCGSCMRAVERVSQWTDHTPACDMCVKYLF